MRTSQPMGDPFLDDVIEWDVSNWSVALDFWRQTSELPTMHVSALEIGSRHGGLSLWLAAQGASVVCTDVNGPTEEARRKHERHGVAGNVRYGSLDALAIPYRSEFDVVTFKSVLGAVGWRERRERRRDAMHQIHDALRPGGELWFAENIAGSPLHGFARRHFVPWGKSWRYPRIDEMLEFASMFSTVKYRTVGVLGAFGRTGRQRALLGRLDQAICDRLVPESWRYIMVGVAKKSA